MPARIELNDTAHDVEMVRDRDGGYVASLAGGDHRFEIDELGCDSVRFRTDGVTQRARFFRDRERLFVLYRGATLAFRDLTLAAPVTVTAAGKVTPAAPQ